MSIDELKKLCDRLAAAKAELEKLEHKQSLCKLSGHQVPISVRVHGEIDVAVSHMDRSYMQSVIRGREMILLGVKKVINGLIDQQRAHVADLEEKISNARIAP